MSIREYSSSNQRAIFDIYNLSKLDEQRFEDNTFSLQPLEEDKVRLQGLMESEIYVYQEHNRIVAYGAYLEKEIRALFVHPVFRSKGIGNKLMRFLLSCINEKAYLYVAASNQPAKILYQQYGFRVTDRFLSTYNKEPVIVEKMELILPKQSED